MKVGIILGDQLSLSLPTLQALDKKRDRLVMAEVPAEATYVGHHKQKIAFIFSAMRHFAADLREAGWQLDYLAYGDHDHTSLLDVLVPRDFAQTRALYFTHAKPQGAGAGTAVARATLSGDGRSLTDWQVIWEMEPGSSGGRHFGSRIVEAPDGHLFVTSGERGDRPSAQDLSRQNGSVIRIARDGTPPADNPFQGQGGAQPGIWSYGHRNPQGMFYNRQTNTLWAIEHGPRGGDEINLVEPGKNYGWPEASHGKEYWGPVAVGEKEVKGMENAKKVYVPSIAPSGLVQYQGNAFPDLQGDLLTGAMALQHLNHIEMDGQKVVDEHRYFEDKKQRIRNVIEGPDGFLYLANDSGEIWQVKPAQ